jgi:hypothetical protein
MDDICNGMPAADLGVEGWRKPWSDNGGDGLEAKKLPGGVALRQGADPAGPGPGAGAQRDPRLHRRRQSRSRRRPPRLSTPTEEGVVADDLGAWLRGHRQAHGWTNRDMASRIIEAGHAADDKSMPSLDTMCRNIGGVHAAGQDRTAPALRGRAFGDYGIMVLGHANPSVLPDRRVTAPRNWWRWNSRGTGPSK